MGGAPRLDSRGRFVLAGRRDAPLGEYILSGLRVHEPKEPRRHTTPPPPGGDMYTSKGGEVHGRGVWVPPLASRATSAPEWLNAERLTGSTKSSKYSMQ